MIRIEKCPAERVRVIGSLQGAASDLLLDAIAQGAVVLDLSEVDRVDERAVRMLAGLPPDRCTLASCPSWLSLWLERERLAAGGPR